MYVKNITVSEKTLNKDEGVHCKLNCLLNRSGMLLCYCEGPFLIETYRSNKKGKKHLQM